MERRSEMQRLKDEWKELKAKNEQTQKVINEWSNNIRLKPTLRANSWLCAQYVQRYNVNHNLAVVRELGSTTYESMRRDSRRHRPAPNAQHVGTPNQRATLVLEGTDFEEVKTFLEDLSQRRHNGSRRPLSNFVPSSESRISRARSTTPPLPANRRTGVRGSQ